MLLAVFIRLLVRIVYKLGVTVVAVCRRDWDQAREAAASVVVGAGMLALVSVVAAVVVSATA